MAGKQQLYAFCQEYGVPHRRLGKLLVASSPAQLDALSALAARAAANGVSDLRPLSKAEVGQLEPAVRCEAALLSPSTGIVDSHRCGVSWGGWAQTRHGWEQQVGFVGRHAFAEGYVFDLHGGMLCLLMRAHQASWTPLKPLLPARCSCIPSLPGRTAVPLPLTAAS